MTPTAATAASSSSSAASAHPSPQTNKVWLITGCSSGLGREIALEALTRGDSVIATARSADRVDDLKQRGAHTAVLDVTSPDDVVRKTVADAVAALGGRVDVLVNNAGYVLVGGFEECSSEEVFDNYNTNVFGLIKVTRAVLPFMRAQQAGVIANIGSSLSRMNFPAIGVYGSTKGAVAGLSEALRAEVAPMGIEVTSFDLGVFRTPFNSNSVHAKQQLEPEASGPVVAGTKAHLTHQRGKELGDPVKGAKVIVDVLTKSGRCAVRASLLLPLRLTIGSDATPLVASVLERDLKELREWTPLLSGTDHDDVVAA